MNTLETKSGVADNYEKIKDVLKLNLLNNLGSITGGMTSTPTLGTLIATSGTDDVASFYPNIMEFELKERLL